MSERVVKVSLTAQVSNYVAGMEQARKATKDYKNEAEEARIKAEAQSQALTQVGAGLVAVGTLAAVGLSIAVKKFADFDQAISNVAAATMESSDNMALLRDAALDAGARTVFSATEAANAIEELGKAGVSTKDILSGGLNASLDLAAAGNLEVADAAGIAAVALKTFNLRGTDMAHVADLLAAGAGKAMGDVTDLSMALRQSGQVAASTGLSIEETTAALSAFASQGLLGSDAGTSFKAMLQRLTPQSKEAADRMQALGISAYDAAGNFVGLEEFAGNLQDSLKGLTNEQRNSAMATIFGSDAVRAATVLYTEGADGIAKWIRNVDDSGYAAEVAAKRLDNLKGDFEKLTGALETAFIKSGSGANDALRLLTQTITGVVESFTELPTWLQQTAFWFGGIATAVTIGAGAFMLAIPKVVEYRLALETLGTGAQKAAGIVGKLGRAVAGLAIAATTIALLDSVAVKTTETDDAVNKLRRSLSAKDMWENAIQGAAVWESKSAAAAEEMDNLGKALDYASNRTWFSGRDMGLDGVLYTAKTLGETLGTLAKNDLPSAQEQFRKLATETDLTKAQQAQLLNEMPAFRDALVEQAKAAGLATDDSTLLGLALGVGSAAAKEQAERLKAVSGAAEDASGKISELEQLIRGFGSATLDANEAERSFQQAVDDAAAALAANGATLDLNTQQGRDNSAALDAMASAANNSAAATFALTGDHQALEAQLATAREQVYQQAKAMGMGEEAARLYAEKTVALASEIEKLPESKNINITATTSGAQSAIDGFVTLNNGRVINIGVRIPSGYQGYITPTLPKMNGGLVDFFGSGGLRESHLAQIAPAGAWRVWAEPETGGEAYIPLSPAKRARSIDIWQETGKRLGVINGYANGGYVRPNYVPAGGTGGLTSYSTSGDTFNASFNVQAAPGLPLEEQVFSAARRLKSRQKVRR